VSALVMSSGPAVVLAAVSPHGVLVLSAILFAVGLVGVACRRNILVMLLSVEILLNAANLAFVAFSKVHGDVTGQVFVFFAMAIAAAEVAVGLAIVIAVYRLRRGVDADASSDLRETDLEGPGPITPEGPDVPASDHDAGHGDAHGGDGGHGHDSHGHDPHAAHAVGAQAFGAQAFGAQGATEEAH